MGMNLMAFTCPNCGQKMSEAIGPNWTVVQSPAPAGWTVVVLTCLNGACNTIIGSYAYPSEGVAGGVGQDHVV